MHGTTARGNGSASFYLCDFDGTVARADVGNRFFATFVAARAEWDSLIEAWIAETMGGREIMQKECELARVDHGAAVAFALAHAELDPGFAAFVGAARAAGGDVAIASDGLLTYIRPILDANGLAHVEASANDAVFEGDRLRPVFGTPTAKAAGSAAAASAPCWLRARAASGAPCSWATGCPTAAEPRPPTSSTQRGIYSNGAGGRAWPPARSRRLRTSRVARAFR
jgi:phosphoserine phosphatase